MKYGVVGTRKGMTAAQKDSFLRALREFPELDHMVHSGYMGRADADAHQIARELGHKITVLSYARSVDVVTHSDVMLVFALPGEFEEKLQSETWLSIQDTQRRIRQRGCEKQLCIIYPDGSTMTEGNSN